MLEEVSMMTNKDERIELCADGIRICVLPFGATLQSLVVNDAGGKPTDVVLGFDTVDEYRDSGLFFGGTIGRCANRIGGASFRLNGKDYPLAANDGVNHLHGGRIGFHKTLWSVTGQSAQAVTFSRVSPDGEEGYPGNLKVSVRYAVDDSRSLRICFDAVSEADTLINLANHAYFNLNGHDSGSAMEHRLQLNADCITENAPGCLPTGRFLPIDGGPFDFREEKALAPGLTSCDRQIEIGRGYDHNFVLNGAGMRKVGRLVGERSGIVMDVETDQPGIQLYSGNFLRPTTGKGGVKYNYRHSVCLETQHFPDAIHHPDFPSVVLKKGKLFHSETVYRFSVLRDIIRLHRI